jgi:hypothetical protein
MLPIVASIYVGCFAVSDCVASLPVDPKSPKRHGIVPGDNHPLVDLSSLKSVPPPGPVTFGLYFTTYPQKYMVFLPCITLGLKLLPTPGIADKTERQIRCTPRCNYVGSISYQEQKDMVLMNIY